ncbi:MAG TPA: MazG nucleotide pyrophosphohydrolase domain-containing protein, partial [Candidatus Limnocylindrales bacterium]
MLDRLIAEARQRWSLDARSGVQAVSADGLAAFPIEPSRLLIVLPGASPAHIERDAAAIGLTPIELPPIPGRHGHGSATPLDVLRRLYPSDHAVAVATAPESRTIADLTPVDLEAGVAIAPLPVELSFGGLWTMAAISDRLRQPDGCPWDREQTHATLRKHLLEEAYEVYDALEAGATPELAGELGDLLLQIVLHAQLAAEAGVFDLSDVNAALARKIVRRHPHVFGEAE